MANVNVHVDSGALEDIRTDVGRLVNETLGFSQDTREQIIHLGNSINRITMQVEQLLGDLNGEVKRTVSSAGDILDIIKIVIVPFLIVLGAIIIVIYILKTFNFPCCTRKTEKQIVHLDPESTQLLLSISGPRSTQLHSPPSRQEIDETKSPLITN